MSRFLRFSMLAVVILLMVACIFTNSGSSNNNNIIAAEAAGLSLAVQAQPNTYTTAGQVIAYNFTVTNLSSTALTGTITVTDDKMAVACPAVNTAGDKDESFETGESVICITNYPINAGDISAGKVTDVASASIGGVKSNTVTTTINLVENKVLTITVAANVATYNGANQQITYTYTVTNTGATTLVNTQFIVRDDHFADPINCGTNQTTLATNQFVQCNAVYTTTSADASAEKIVNTASASGGGAGTIQPASTTVTNAAPGGSGSYTKGSTIMHDVVKGEWMLQIARCYGASFDAVKQANPQVSNPNLIYPTTTKLTVPNIGSVGPIYKPPCVIYYKVKSGDTWQSIASDPNHNAALNILMEANRGVTLSAGVEIKIPRNSKYYENPLVTPPPTTNPTKQPIRLTFTPTSPKVTLSGNIATPETISHIFTASTGQILTVKLTAPTNDINLGIYAPNGTAIKPLDLVNSWSGTLSAIGDYKVDLVSSVGAASKQYTLEITLTTVSTSSIERVVDINPGAGDSGVSYLRSFKGQLYFQANRNDGAGAELWRYDTSLKALSLVRDINAGAAGSDPAFLTEYGDMLYFRANGNDQGGTELWRFNGSDTGRVTDINSGVADSNPAFLTVFKNALYFRATGSDGRGSEIWKYDGGNPLRVSDINPDAGDSNPAYLTEFNGALYFSAMSNDGKGTELWKYDGTNAPTLVADINVGLGSSNPSFLTVFNGVLYFSANGNDNTGTELWKYDGTNPPVRAFDINPGPADSAPTYLTLFNNALYFSANGDASGFELWKFDGATATRVVDINTAGSSNPAYLTVHNNELYFQANANDGAGAELWKFKGP